MASSLTSSLNRLIRTLQSQQRQLSPIRFYSSKRNNLYSHISPLGNPKISVATQLDTWVDSGKNAHVAELQRIIRDLRKNNRYTQALEVSEWMGNKNNYKINPSDHAVRLDLIGKVRGLDSAESYFNSLTEGDRTFKTYGALLNCYVRERLPEKALSHMQKMKELGFASLALPYNDLMCLYTNTAQHEKVLSVFSEMKENGIAPDNFSYRLCANSYGMRSDLDGMEKIIHEIECRSDITIDWNVYCNAANFYIKAKLTTKAVEALRKAEEKLLKNADPMGYKHLISLYGNLENKTELLRLWKLLNSVCRRLTNKDYITMLGSLVKLGAFEDAETVLNAWESSGCYYDFRVPNVILSGYCQKGFVGKAEAFIEEMVNEGKTPLPISYGFLAAGFVKRREMEKAVEFMKKALSVACSSDEWKPNPKLTAKILRWLGDQGNTEKVEDFVRLLTNVMPMNRVMYHALIKANILAGRDVDGILERMKVDNVEVTLETMQILNLHKQETDGSTKTKCLLEM